MFLDNSKTSRNPERIIAKIQKTQKPVRMRGIFRKWNNPEIRQAAARQLQPVDTAEMLNIMYKAEREEVLSFYTDISELKELSRFCRGEVKSSVDWRIRELYRELLSESPEQEWLNKVICNESDMTIRKEAAEKLTEVFHFNMPQR